MLTSSTVKNLALVDRVSEEFGFGLNVTLRPATHAYRWTLEETGPDNA